MASSNRDTVIFAHQLLLVLANDEVAPAAEGATREALGRAAWLEAFWMPAQQRKHPRYKLEIKKTTVSVLAKTEDSDGGSLAPKEPDMKGITDWNKLIQTALKKIQVEDLGELAAQDLLASIPVEDREGRGQKDLEKLEKQLSVKVVFLEDHILLVGAKVKLEKKCLVIRNVLSHYYWRLKGKQINL